jgi:hypothetical protein
VRDELSPVSFSLIPVKFSGGLIAIGSGLALGREGPIALSQPRPSPATDAEPLAIRLHGPPIDVKVRSECRCGFAVQDSFRVGEAGLHSCPVLFLNHAPRLGYTQFASYRAQHSRSNNIANGASESPVVRWRSHAQPPE